MNPGEPNRTMPLTLQQERAVLSLLAEPTVERAAKKAGCTDRAIYKWLAEDPDFAAEYRAARRGAMEAATARLQALAAKAAATLEAIMDDAEAKDSSRVAAARAVLELAFRATAEEDVLPRLQALEERLGKAA